MASTEIVPIELSAEEKAFIDHWVEMEVQKRLLEPFRITAEREASTPFFPFFWLEEKDTNHA